MAQSSDRYTPVEADGNKTRITISLQNVPNNMEPSAEPRRIQVNDRASVVLRLTNLSPLDVCTLGARTPSPTPETNVAESITGTIAALGPLGILPGGPGALPGVALHIGAAVKNLEEMVSLVVAPTLPSVQPKCNVSADPEYKQIGAVRSEFTDLAGNYFDQFNAAACDADTLQDPNTTQILSLSRISCQLDRAAKNLANYAAADYRAGNQSLFKANWSQLDKVRAWYATPIPTVAAAARLQAMLDEMTTWQGDLHKKYDYQVPSPAGGSSAMPVLGPVNGAPIVIAGPLNLSYYYSDPATAPAPQTITVASAGVPAAFSVTPISPSTAQWLAVSAPCLPSSCRTGTSGAVNLIVTVDPGRLNGKTTDSASFRIEGTGGALGSNVINVTIQPSSAPTECDLQKLRDVDQIVDRAKAVMALIATNNTNLQSAQTSLKTSFMALKKVSDDFDRNTAVAPPGPIKMAPPGILYQDFNLGTDRKAAVTGAISCVSDLDGKTPTTDPINFSILYQEVPHWSASAGLLFSFQRKKVIGLNDEGGAVPTTSNPQGTAPTSYFAITDSARAQVIPMAFVNYRFTPYSFKYDNHMVHYGKNKEDTLAIAAHLTAGIGVNSNNGANQPEFFAGVAIGLNRFLIHPGVHIGRVPSLGGGYSLNTPAPPGVTVPINWNYHATFSIAFSVRVAPY